MDGSPPPSGELNEQFDELDEQHNFPRANPADALPQSKSRRCSGEKKIPLFPRASPADALAKKKIPIPPMNALPSSNPYTGLLNRSMLVLVRRAVEHV